MGLRSTRVTSSSPARTSCPGTTFRSAARPPKGARTAVFSRSRSARRCSTWAWSEPGGRACEAVSAGPDLVVFDLFVEEDSGLVVGLGLEQRRGLRRHLQGVLGGVDQCHQVALAEVLVLPDLDLGDAPLDLGGQLHRADRRGPPVGVDRYPQRVLQRRDAADGLWELGVELLLDRLDDFGVLLGFARRLGLGFGLGPGAASRSRPRAAPSR